jgi:hypothetical protein
MYNRMDSQMDRRINGQMADAERLVDGWTVGWTARQTDSHHFMINHSAMSQVQLIGNWKGLK